MTKSNEYLSTPCPVEELSDAEIEAIRNAEPPAEAARYDFEVPATQDGASTPSRRKLVTDAG